jgi:flagellar hook-basal body complex protein FliE
MTLNPPSLIVNNNLPLSITNVKHINPVEGTGDYFPTGRQITGLGDKIGAEAVLRAGSFDDMMLKALDKVSGDERYANELIQKAVIDPDSVDAHDITIAQAKAAMSLNIARTVLSRLVQSWKDIINTR